MHPFNLRPTRFVAGLPVALLLLGCSLSNAAAEAFAQTSPARRSGVERDTLPPDSALFAAVMRDLQAHERAIRNHGGWPLWANPHPLTTDLALRRASPEALARVPEQVVRDRAAVLDRLRVPQFRAFPHDRCANAGAALPGRETAGLAVEPISCVLVSLARPLEPSHPRDRSDEPAGQWRRWIMRVFDYGSDFNNIRDFILERDSEAGMWRVAEQYLVSTRLPPHPPFELLIQAADEDTLLAAALEAYAEHENTRRVVVRASTEPLVRAPATWERIASIPGMAESTMADFEARHDERRRIGPLPPTRVTVTLVEQSDLTDLPRGETVWDGTFWRALSAKYPGAVGYMNLSRPGISADRTQAVVIIEHHCGVNCGIAYAVLLTREAGGWRLDRMAGLYMWH